MGGFKLKGPNVLIKYVNKSEMDCLCSGLKININAEQEKKFIGKSSMTLKEFHDIFENKYTKYHIYVSDSESDSRSDDDIVIYYKITNL
jgi:hypothetical protein